MNAVLAGIIGAAVLATTLAASSETARADIKLPFRANLASASLEPEWNVRFSEGNSYKIQDEWLTVEAGEDSYGHIQRPLGVDYVTVTARIGMCASMYIVWDENNWCGVGKFTPSPFGRFYTTVTEEGKTIETDHRGCHIGSAHYIEMQLGKDCVRFSYSNDKKNWIWLRTIERPAGFSGAPKLVAIGKHYLPGQKPFSEISTGSSAGTRFAGSISEITIEATPANNMNITSAERKELRNNVSDRVGSILLSRPEDPTYASVSKFYPPMKFPRELVGVPEHPLDIGVDYYGRFDVSPWTPPLAWIEVGDPAVTFGGENIKMTRRLLDGYLPVLTLTTKREGVKYEMTVFGWSEGFSPDKDLYAFARMRATASSAAKLHKKISLIYEGGAKRVDLNLTGTGKSAEVCFRFKYPEPGSAVEIPASEFNDTSTQIAELWREKIKPAERFEIPDKRVSEAYKAWFVYSLLNADKINGYTEIHDGAGFYEEIFGVSMTLHSMAMDVYGLHNYAEKLLDTLMHFQQPDGLYYQACGLQDHGSFLEAMAQHYNITKDKAWLKRVAPNIISACEWLIRQRQEAPKDGLTRGLVKFRPYNDFQYAVFNYNGDVYACEGLKMAADVLQEAGMNTEAKRYGAEAIRYRKDILESMNAAAFKDGDMELLPLEPDTHRMLKAGKYRGGDHYGLVVGFILDNNFLEPDSKPAQLFTGIMEKRKGLVAGVCEFMEGIDHAYTYGYLMNQMKRDDVKKVVLGFWSMLAFGMTRDTYSPVEVSQIKTGENHLTLPHTYSLTQQLRLLRSMLVWEDGSILRIANATPREWLQPGKRIAAEKAPTLFGEVSFSITSNADGTMHVSITPESGKSIPTVTVRLRHPDFLNISELKSTKTLNAEFSGEMITIKDLASPATFDVKFKLNN